MSAALLEDFRAAFQILLAENAGVLEKVDARQLTALIREIDAAKRVFFFGEGRSGLVLRMAAMRFMHMGRVSYVVGETTTPSIQAGDLLIAASGSGTTANVLNVATAAKKTEARVFGITTLAQSPLAQAADESLELHAPAKNDRTQAASRQFAGSLFEQATLLLFDTVFYLLTSKIEAKTLWARHTNLE